MQIAFRLERSDANIPRAKEVLALDTDYLDQDGASELKNLVADSRLFDLPIHVTSPALAAAEATIEYFLRVEISRQSRSLRITEPVEDPALRRLLIYLIDRLAA